MPRVLYLPNPSLANGPAPDLKGEKHWDVSHTPRFLYRRAWSLHETLPGVISLSCLNPLVSFPCILSINHLRTNPQLIFCLWISQFKTLSKLFFFFFSNKLSLKSRKFFNHLLCYFRAYREYGYRGEVGIVMFHQTPDMHQRIINRSGKLEKLSLQVTNNCGQQGQKKAQCWYGLLNLYQEHFALLIHGTVKSTVFLVNGDLKTLAISQVMKRNAYFS